MSFCILLSVYKNESPSFLDASLNSIWDTQILKPKQIVLVKDGPLTHSLDSVINFWGERLGEILTVVSLKNNVGLGAALNEGIKYCRFELVARMDTDDVAMPERFVKQVKFMQANPDIVASSAQVEEWNSDFTELIGTRKLPLAPSEVIRFAKRRSPLSHPVSIFRKKIVLDVGGYPPLRKAQDFALWSLLLSKGYKLANMPDILLKMRAGDELISRRGWSYYKHEIQLYSFQKRIGFLSTSDYVVNIIGKGILRLAPNFIKTLIYRQAR